MAKTRKPKALAPRTTPADPEASGSRGITLIVQRTAGVIVNEDTALMQSTVWACIRCISESLAGMPWRAGKLMRDGSIDALEDHPINWLLNFAPNDETPSFAFRETMWAWALGWGNGYAEIERNIYGDPVALWQLHPSRVTPIRTPQGVLLYEVNNDGAEPTYLAPRNMFHLKGPSPDGLVGWSVIRMHARTIGLAIAQEDNAASFNANDSTPGGVLEHPGRLGDVARKNLEESWNRRHRGPNNRRTVAILEEGLKWSQTGLPPDDAKLVEQMQLTPAMICRIFRVPPHKVADLTRSTNNNIEHQDIEFVKDTLRPWAERGESEADMKLFGRNNQGRLVTVIDLSERERGDTAAQTDHVERMTFCGVYSINEARRYLGLQGIGPEGDTRFVQSAMIPIDQAGQQNPKPDAIPPEDSTDPPEDEPPTMEEEGETLGIVQEKSLAALSDACRRVFAREVGQREQQGGLSPEWLAKHRSHARDTLAIPASVLGACIGADGAAVDVAVSLYLDKHLEAGERTPAEAAIQLREYIIAATAAKGVA